MNEAAFIKIRRPNTELVRFLYRNFSFSSESMLSDYSKLYCKIPSKKAVHFDIVIAINENRIVGWGITSENVAGDRKSVNYRDIFEGNYCLLMIYVDKRQRKRGIASGIIKQLIRFAPRKKFIVIAHDKASFSFFAKWKKRFSSRIKIIDWR